MNPMLDEDISRALPGWVEHSLKSRTHILATSNQGTVLHYQDDGLDLVIKTAMGKGAVLHARRTTLQREAKAYELLAGVEGVPRSYGLVCGRYLALEHVNGVPYRDAEIPDRDVWFGSLLATIRACHERGVAHGDLKSKSNLMVREDGSPCIIDFGTTVVFRPGFHPFNHQLFSYLKQLDLNAWVKHKYRGRYEDASNEDRALLKYSLFESLLRKYRNRNLP